MSKYSELADLAVKNIELSYSYEESSLKLAHVFSGELREYLGAPNDTVYLVQLNENLNGVVNTVKRPNVIAKVDGKCYIGLKMHFKSSESRYFGGMVLEVGIQYGSPISTFHVLGKTFNIDENSENPYLALCEYVYAGIEKEYSTEVNAPKNGIGFIR
ncbi:hypothetical protein [Pseudocolwellia agarivorans]|uniref:hypothetical protein n=1 Tax=Pseudocolwellia agarivorans TaxID=1911682 RepID=UPI0009857699|nr:hypothetical protein [Pseudocolwellia agarivorans]